MSKPVFVISCPIDTYSGYGARSRDIVKAIIELDKYEVKVLPQRWGNTPFGFIQNNPEWEFLTNYFLPKSTITSTTRNLDADYSSKRIPTSRKIQHWMYSWN
jgi:hypothetical protein